MIVGQDEWWAVKLPRGESVGVYEERDDMANTAQSGDLLGGG
jgi:hypothetical protein